MKESLLWRILGNDIPDRHAANQTYKCLQHILVNEDSLPHCQRRFLVNRIACDNKREKLLDLLMTFGEDFTEIPFNLEAYERLPHEQRAGYLTNQADAKNFCIDWGLEKDFDFVLPFDGQIFIRPVGWEHFQRQIDEEYGTLAGDNQAFLALLIGRSNSFDTETFDDPSVIQNKESWLDTSGMTHFGVSAPQIIFSERADIRYRDLPYGVTSVDMLQRLGLAGLWDKLDPDTYWQASAHKSAMFGKVFAAGFGIRLPSGEPDLDVDGWKRHFARQTGVQKLVLQVNSLVEEN
jgi:hypothetical protein